MLISDIVTNIIFDVNKQCLSHVLDVQAPLSRMEGKWNHSLVRSANTIYIISYSFLLV